MITTLSQFHFLRPEFLWALLPLLFIVWVFFNSKRQQSNWQNVCDKHLLAHLLIERGRNRGRWPLYLLALGWICAVIAMAGPTWQRMPQVVYRAFMSRVIVLDMSHNMNATDIMPNRLTRAKYKVLDILKQNKDQRTAMVVFTSESFVISPLTEDTETINMLIPSLDTKIMPVAGSDISVGLEQAAKLLKQADAIDGDIILITGSDVTDHDLQTANNLRKQGYNTSVLGMGTAKGSPLQKPDGGFEADEQGAIIISKLDVARLQQLAAKGGGRYHQFSVDDADVQYLLNSSLQQRNMNEAKLSKETTDIWIDEGKWFILLTVIIALLVFRRGWFAEVLR